MEFQIPKNRKAELQTPLSQKAILHPEGEWTKAKFQFLLVLAALPPALAGGKSDSKVVLGFSQIFDFGIGEDKQAPTARTVHAQYERSEMLGDGKDEEIPECQRHDRYCQ